VAYRQQTASNGLSRNLVQNSTSQYEEVDFSQQVVDNTLYEPTDIPSSSDYDHLWKNRNIPESTGYAKLSTL